MNRSDAPAKKPVPFAVNGPREAILETTPAGDNQASYDAGFPPITMILKSAGGKPPKGEDMNQILYELAQNARWNQAGAGYQFDSAFSTGISGYPIGAILQNSTGDGTWINTLDGNTNNPEVATATPLTGWIPLDSNGVTTKTGLTNANVTLTTLEASRDRIILSGTLTGNINIIFPAWLKSWRINNNTSGSFTVTAKTTSGTGVMCPQGSAIEVIGDGTNISLKAGTASLQNVGVGAGNIPDMSSFTSSISSSGWQKLPSGLIIQWGQQNNAASATTTATYPIPFPNSTLQVVASGYQVAANVQAYVTINGIGNVGFFTWQAFYANGGTAPSLASIAGQVQCRYIAIGW